MSVQERARLIRSDVTEKRLHHGLEKTERERDRLKVENDVLRDRMVNADRERERLMHSVDDLAKKRSAKPRKHRLRRLMVLSAAAGSAYVLGAKAGRQRYEELRSRWSSLRDRMQHRGDDAWTGEPAISPASEPTEM